MMSVVKHKQQSGKYIYMHVPVISIYHLMSIKVTVVGDSRRQEVVVAGDRLTDYDALITIGEELSLPSPIRRTRQELLKRIFR